MRAARVAEHNAHTKKISADKQVEKLTNQLATATERATTAQADWTAAEQEEAAARVDFVKTSSPEAQRKLLAEAGLAAGRADNPEAEAAVHSCFSSVEEADEEMDEEDQAEATRLVQLREELVQGQRAAAVRKKTKRDRVAKQQAPSKQKPSEAAAASSAGDSKPDMLGR